MAEPPKLRLVWQHPNEASIQRTQIAPTAGPRTVEEHVELVSLLSALNGAYLDLWREAHQLASITFTDYLADDRQWPDTIPGHPEWDVAIPQLREIRARHLEDKQKNPTGDDPTNQEC